MSNTNFINFSDFYFDAMNNNNEVEIDHMIDEYSVYPQVLEHKTFIEMCDEQGLIDGNDIYISI